MEMKKMHHNTWLVGAAVLLLSAACTTDDALTVKDESKIAYPEIHVRVSDMEMTAESRAAQPMSPDLEKYVRSIAVFEFDNEGFHDKTSKTYHYIDFVKGTVDGDKNVGVVESTEYGIVETKLTGIAFEPYDNGTICLVANVKEAQVDSLYENYREEGQSYGRMTLDKFKTWALPFEYEEVEDKTYDESTAGHLKFMYMFGYYEGKIDPAKPGEIYVDLGRLASRLDITVVNETGEELTKRLGYHFDNVCSSAFFFPMKMGMPPKIGRGMTRTVICSGKDDPVEGDKSGVQETFKAGDSHTAYFYVAAHSASGYDEATKLHLFYDNRIVDDSTGDNSKSVTIPMCNVRHPDAADVPNGYSLSRNTRYHFTIHLKKKGATQSAQSMTSRSVEYGEQPGDIIVYLP